MNLENNLSEVEPFSIIRNSKEQGADVKARLRQEKGKDFSFTRGRAMVMDSFKTTSQIEATFMFYHLHIMKSGGDNKRTILFYNRWLKY